MNALVPELISGPVVLKNATIFDGVEIKRHWSIMSDAGVVSYLGPDECLRNVTAPVIDCGGMFVSPSFGDSHLHLLGHAARSLGTDLASLEFSSVAQVVKELRDVEIDQEHAEWIRLYGYDDTKLSGSKFLNRWDLDQVFPHRPVIIHFDSGHQTLINSRGLEKLGITESTDEPDGVTFDRDTASGRLTGVILEGNGYIEKYMPKLNEKLLQRSLRDSFDYFVSQGITGVTDATENNDVDRLNFISSGLEEAGHPIDVEFMPGFNMLDELRSAQIPYGTVHNGLLIGPVKIMLSSSSGDLRPDITELFKIVNECHISEFPVAIHAVTEQEIDLALRVFSKSHMSGDRIEHASETRDDQIERIASLGLWISTQPGFIYNRGDRYISQGQGSDLNILYRLRSLIEKGIRVGGSSDTPVIMPDPLNSIYSCITRKTQSKQFINQSESLSIIQSLRILTTGNSDISAGSVESSRLQTGRLLDIVILSEDISVFSEDTLLKTEVIATVKNGELEYVSDGDLLRPSY